jgi:hypothetical protein
MLDRETKREKNLEIQDRDNRKKKAAFDAEKSREQSGQKDGKDERMEDLLRTVRRVTAYSTVYVRERGHVGFVVVVMGCFSFAPIPILRVLCVGTLTRHGTAHSLAFDVVLLLLLLLLLMYVCRWTPTSLP